MRSLPVIAAWMRDDGTRLAAILGRRDWTVRSGHHQDVDTVGAALRRAAVAADGVVEAVEHRRAWAVGVQWHPADDDGAPENRTLLSAALRQAALARRGGDRTG